MARPRRLSGYDLHCLAAETPARPLHLGILAVLDGGAPPEDRALLDPAGGLRLDAILRELNGRLAGLPELRRVVYRPGRLAGRPLWVDDPGFRIDRHVGGVELPAPSDDAALMALVEALLATPLDRSRPLWRMWFVTGLEGGRIALLVVLHHALADGMTAMRMVRSLLEPPMHALGETAAASSAEADASVTHRNPIAQAPPPWGLLVRDDLRGVLAAASRLIRPTTWRSVVEMARFGWQAYTLGRRTPPSSLNAPVGPRRRLSTIAADSATAKRVARAAGCGVNDVVLSVVAGGVGALLAARGEPVERLRPRAGIAVALFSLGRGSKAGNDIGTLHVPLPIGEPDPLARLPVIAAARAEARRSPMVAAEPILRAWLGRFEGFRRSLDHQRLVNLAETYLPGPPAPIEVLGARVLELIPIAPLAGNLGLSFVAFSYAGRLLVTVRADADRFPDFDVLVAAMERDWAALAGSVAPAGRLRDGRAVALDGVDEDPVLATA